MENNSNIQLNESIKRESNRSDFISIILLVLSLGYSGIAQDIPVNSDCDICTDIQSYPQLASVQSSDGEISELILNQLLGIDFNMSALNWQGLIQSEFTLDRLLLDLAGSLNLSSPQEVLDADITIDELLTALVTIADNAGTIAALNEIISANTTSGTISLSDLLQVNTIDESLADIELRFFDIITGAVELYNYNNVLTTNAPINLNVPSIGDISLQAQIVEPPNIVCGQTGTQVFSAGVRLKLDVDITDILIPSIPVQIDVLTIADVEGTLAQVNVYLDIARGLTTLNTVDGANNEIAIQAQPGIARAFVGNIDNSDFFDRTKDPINFLSEGNVGELTVSVSSLPIATLDITAVTHGDASTLSETIDPLMIPFDIEIGSSTTAISNLISDLLINSQINISSSIPLTPLLTTVINEVLDDITTITDNNFFTEDAIVHDVLETIGDPALRSLGTSIGEILLASDQLLETCLDFGDAPNSFNTMLADNGPRHVIDDSLFLGIQAPESDPNGMPNIQANVDLAEDAVSSFPSSISGGTYVVDATVTNLSSDSAQVVAWIDFDQDGTFENNYERSIIQSSANVQANYTGQIPVTWENIPNGISPISKYMRIRVSSSPMFFRADSVRPTGFVMDGEIEDYLITPISLPVTFIDFQLSNLNERISIQWQTTNEVNLQRYYVERSDDGQKFYTINEMEPEYQSMNSYQIIDDWHSGKQIYYRVASIDIDGTTEYTDVKAISRPSSRTEVYVNPNPCIDKLNISHGLEDDVYISIHDMQGMSIVKSQLYYAEDGAISIDISQLTVGNYILRIASNLYVDNILFQKVE